MARINLLPWRAERQKERKKQFFLMLAMSALAGLAVWFLINAYYNGQIAGQQARNAFLDQEIVAVQAKITEIQALEDKKNKLLNRKKVIEELQANRSQMVHLFDSLVRTIPDGVALAGIKQEGDILTLEGRSQSNARVSTYMRNLEGSGWMTNPDLSIIEAKAEDKGPSALSGESRSLPYVFTLKVKLANPNEADQKNGATGAVIGPAADAATPASPVAPAVEKAASPAATPATTPASPATPATPAATPVEKPAAPATKERPAS